MSQSTNRKEPEHYLRSFRMTEAGEGDSASLCFLVADVYPEQSHGISISVTTATEAWAGEYMLIFRFFHCSKRARSRRTFEGRRLPLLAGVLLRYEGGTVQDKSEFHITTENTMKARKPALRVSWSKTVRNKNEEIGTILLSKSTSAAPTTKKFMKLAVARATKVSRRNVELKASVDAMDAPFEAAVEVAKQIVEERQREYITILSKTKLLLDAKSEFADSMSSADNELDDEDGHPPSKKSRAS